MNISYVFTVFVIPILIVLINWFLIPKKDVLLLNLLQATMNSIKYFITYYFVLYFLEREHYVSGWYSLPFSVYFIPISIIILLVKVIVLIKRRYN